MFWISIAISVVVLALVLTAYGWIGRVVGLEPFCRRCRHNLTGLTSNQCPECGTEVSADSIRWGLRRKRPLPLAAGLLLTCGVLTVAGLYLAKVSAVTNWYTWAPVWMLLDMGERKDVKAIRELVARFEDDRLKGNALADAINVALEQHEKVAEDAIACEWADLLAAFDLSNGLEGRQKTQFYTNIIHSMKLVPREIVRVGDQEVIEARAILRGSKRLDGLLQWKHAVSGDPDFPGSSDRWFSVHFPYRQGTESTILTSWRGQKRAEGFVTRTWTITTALFDPSSNPESDEPLWQRSFDLCAEYQVVSAGLDPIVMVKRDSAPVITLQSLSRDDNSLSINLQLESSADLCLAFDVVGRIGALQLPLGCVAWEAGSPGYEVVSYFCGGHYVPPDERAPLPEEASEIEIILFPSRNAASRTLTCYEVLDLEVSLGAFPIPADGERLSPARQPMDWSSDVLN